MFGSQGVACFYHLGAPKSWVDQCSLKAEKLHWSNKSIPMLHACTDVQTIAPGHSVHLLLNSVLTSEPRFAQIILNLHSWDTWLMGNNSSSLCNSGNFPLCHTRNLHKAVLLHLFALDEWCWYSTESTTSHYHPSCSFTVTSDLNLHFCAFALLCISSYWFIDLQATHL